MTRGPDVDPAELDDRPGRSGRFFKYPEWDEVPAPLPHLAPLEEGPSRPRVYLKRVHLKMVGQVHLRVHMKRVHLYQDLAEIDDRPGRSGRFFKYPAWDEVPIPSGVSG